MRIMDWSSDVCSSDLGSTGSQACKTQSAKIAGGREGRECQPFGNTPTHVGNGNVGACLEARLEWKRRDMIGERTNDVSGLWSVSVDMRKRDQSAQIRSRREQQLATQCQSTLIAGILDYARRLAAPPFARFVKIARA